jgi:hypothetical protein
MKFNLPLIAIVISFYGCIPENDFNLPVIHPSNAEVVANSNIKSAINALKQSEEKTYTFNQNDNAIIEGFVISSDEAGNFYKTMIIQDKIENPDCGIVVLIDTKAYYTKYNFGRKIYIKLSGLSIKEEKGQYLLGYLNANKVINIPDALLDHFIIRSQTTEEILAREIALEEISNQMINTYVKITDLQFAKDASGKTFASENFDRYNGERIIEQCDNLVKSFLFTSTFSDFRSNLLPQERFYISAVLTKDYYSDKIVLILNDPSFLISDDSDRCDPTFYECFNEEEIGNTVVYYEDFDGFKSSSDIEEKGWVNINVNFGNGKFKKRSADENSFLQVSAYNSGENVMDIWLVSPSIDLEKTENERLTFNTRATYEEGRILSVWVCDDFNGNVAMASWQLLDVMISDGTRDRSNKEFKSSGGVDLGCLNGKVNLGFRYLGSDPGVSTTYDLDNILIIGD